MDQQEKLKYQATSEVSEIVNDSLYPFVLPHSVADWNQASDVWISFGDGGDKWNWLINHAELLTPAMLENVKTELWVNKYYSNMQEIENQWTAIYPGILRMICRITARSPVQVPTVFSCYTREPAAIRMSLNWLKKFWDCKSLAKNSGNGW